MRLSVSTLRKLMPRILILANKLQLLTGKLEADSPRTSRKIVSPEPTLEQFGYFEWIHSQSKCENNPSFQY